MPILSALFGGKPKPNLQFLISRSRELALELRSYEVQVERVKADLLTLEAEADEAGLADKLAAALAPPAPLPEIPMTRIRATKPYRAMFRGRYGLEEYSGAAGSVSDIPTALLPDLRDRVKVVPPSTEIRGLPLQPGMVTDD